jgi:hypothetical protein
LALVSEQKAGFGLLFSWPMKRAQKRAAQGLPFSLQINVG